MNYKFSKTIIERFWKQVIKLDKNHCWNWVGALTTGGYGSINKGFWHGGNVAAHRVSWIIHYGNIPATKHVLHKCDNRLCVSPNHLYLGTNKDNVRDRVSRGREGDRSGEKNGRAKLNQEDVNYIRSVYNGKYGQRTVLAYLFNVSPITIWGIVTRRYWK